MSLACINRDMRHTHRQNNHNNHNNQTWFGESWSWPNFNLPSDSVPSHSLIGLRSLASLRSFSARLLTRSSSSHKWSALPPTLPLFLHLANGLSYPLKHLLRLLFFHPRLWVEKLPPCLWSPRCAPFPQVSVYLAPCSLVIEIAGNFWKFHS